MTRVRKGLDLEAKIDEVDSVDVDTEVVEFNARELDGLLFLQQASFVNVATMSLHLQIFILLNECMLNSNFYFLKVDEVNKTANN